MSANQWFRSWHGAPTEHKWRLIAKKSQAPVSLVVHFFWAILDRASQSEDRGSFEGFDYEVFADFVDTDVETLKRIETQLSFHGVIDAFHISNWEKRQPKKEDATSTERVRRHRENLRNSDTSEIETPVKRDETLVKRSETQRREEERREDKRESEGAGAPPPPKKSSPSRSRIPADWSPCDKARSFAFENGFNDDAINLMADQFRDHHLKKGDTMADWLAAWRTWVRNELKFNPPGKPSARKAPVYTAAI